MPDALLRPAIEAAVAVARAGEDAVPVLPAPPGLRPFLHFSKLPPRALVAARRALEVDAEFRARVAEEVSEAGAGRAGWLFLTRPEGWADEVATLAQAAEEARGSVAERRAVTEARRRQAAADVLVRKAEEAAAAARAEASRAAAALAEERQSRRAASQEAAQLAQRLSEVTAELERARAETASAVAGAREARTRVSALEGELESLTRALAVPPLPAPSPTAVPAPPAPPPTAVPAAVARALSEAARGARQLAEALASASAAVEADQIVPGAAISPAGGGGRSTVAGAARRGPDAGSGRRPPRRSPAALPPGVLDDSPAAAEHLVRLRGAIVLVDGYNVSNAGWPGRPIAEQRRRLVDALTGLTARTGADVRVVFDGAEIQEPASVAAAPRAVRVSFSPPGVEADDLILGQVVELPAGRPVVVATSDRRVQMEAARQGANVVSSRQLLTLLR